MKNLWGRTKQALKDRVDEKNYYAWIEPIDFAGGNKDSLLLEAENKFYRKWFIDNYLSLTEQLLVEFSERDIKVTVKIADKQLTLGETIMEASTSRDSSRSKKPGRPPKLPQPVFNPRYTFANFIEGPNNQMARAASQSVASKPGRSFNPLFLYGGTGLGKTHLLNAIGNALFEGNADRKVVSLSSEKFINEMIEAIHRNKFKCFRNKYRTCDCLLIDDIQFLSGKERTQEEFFHTFNSLYEAGNQIVITSDRVPKEIPDIEDRLRTRFGWGLVADIQPPELETRLAILKEKACVEKIDLPDDVAFFLASKFDNSVRDLEGAFIRLSAYSSFSGCDITLEMAQKALSNMISGTERVITVDMVQKSVCDFFKVKLSDIKSVRRQRVIAVPRQIGMFLSRKLTDSSFPVIGDQFGGRDHSTVIHACNKIEKLSTKDPSMAQTLLTLEKTLRN